MSDGTTRSDSDAHRLVRSHAHRAVALTSDSPSERSSGSEWAVPILDGTKSAPRLVLADVFPASDADPCGASGHDHSDRRGGVDVPCALAGWFVDRAPSDAVYLATLTHDPKRFAGTGRGPLALRDRVGHAGALKAADEWYESLRQEDPAVSVLYGMEAHKSGARHAHALVSTTPDFRYRRPSAMWFDRYGYSLFERVRSVEAAGRYAGKYVTKELGVVRIALGGGDFR